MSHQYDTQSIPSSSAEESQQWAQRLEQYLAPFLDRLDAYLDRRVVGNLAAAVASSVQTERDITAMVIRTTRRWGSQGLQVFDRGYASRRWLWRCGQQSSRFVVRWKKGNKLMNATGQERKAWEIARGKRIWGERKPLWDPQARTDRPTGVLAIPVRHAEYPSDLFLVVVRQGAGREPWYLLTNERVETAEQAWEVVYAYATQGKSEEHFRFDKHELQMESFRGHDEEAQRKLLMLVTLAASFLLAALAPALSPARTRLLHRWCQRADWRLESVRMPVYRLRWALSRLWLAHPPRLRCCRPHRAPTHITWPVGSLRWWMTLWHAVDLPFELLA